MALVGGSGSGKTTLLRMLAGLDLPDEGRVLLDGRVISDPGYAEPPERRRIGFVFQHHALFPHLTVERNLAFGLHGRPRREQAETIAALLELVGLPHCASRYPHELSGGERQRIALARALAPDPGLLLLDEPFSSLDEGLRQEMRDETRAILKAKGATAVIVTHDTRDALSMADRIVVLREGIVQQTGTPEEIYYSPANAGVASFFGECNFLPVSRLMHPSGDPVSCAVGPPPGSGREEGENGGMWVRPESLEVAAPMPDRPEILHGVVRHVGFRGGHFDVRLECGQPPDAYPVLVRQHQPPPVGEGQRAAVLPLPRSGGR